MRTPLLASTLIGMMAALGCQEPCTTTMLQPGNYRDTLIVQRTYADCNDTLNYHEVQMRQDSTILAEGEVMDGRRQGIWTLNGWRKEIVTYAGGVEINIKEFDRNDLLSSERTLTPDSLYFEQQYDEQGRVILDQYVNMDGYLTGHGVTYDSLGRKTSEGEHIPEPCLIDTVYIESPDPPYDLQMTIIEELGGRHGLWTYYDTNGHVVDTIMYDHGVPLRDAHRYRTGFHQQGLQPETHRPAAAPAAGGATHAATATPRPKHASPQVASMATGAEKPPPLPEDTREFEGRITYRVDVEYAIIRGEGWHIIPVGTKREIFYKKGNWLERSNGRTFEWRLYLQQQNRHYICHNYIGDQSIVWTHGAYLPDFAAVRHVEVNERADTILGHPCDQVILYTDNDTAEYFYSHDLPLDHRHFEKCRGQHFNVWTRYAQAVPLKMVFASKSFGKQKYSLTATHIQPMRIDDRVFTMPVEGRKTEADWSDAHLDFIASNP